ncbi:MAG: hypothetical protein JWL82_44 [Parcubacteria group bacterium]|nr:hypothetical protein [Parcubacteria group bacterium]
MKIPPGLYHHYKDKTKLYDVMGVAFQTETEEELVVYRPLYEVEHEFFARPLAMFLENVDVPELGYSGPRFVFVREKQ